MRTNRRQYRKKQTRKQKAGALGDQQPSQVIQNNEPDSSPFFANPDITTEPYTGSELKSVGIIHATGSAGSNVIREAGTGLFNFFGSAGFQNSRYDISRNDALKNLEKAMSEKGIKKVCNMRMDIDVSNKALFVTNIYGTAYQ
jgi:uncharacterized protein YbjQ (UPF0145 family)